MFFPTYALLSSKVIVDPILYISTGSIGAVVSLNVQVGGTQYLIGNNTVDVFPLTTPTAQEFTTPGTYSWTAPAGVTSVNVVAVGGGSAGLGNGTGGAGGGLGWKNNIAVTPGEIYTVVVGGGGLSDGVYPRGYGPSTMKGGDSYFINTSTVAGFGGEIPYWTDVLEGFESARQTPGGGYVGDGGGVGGEGGRGFAGQNNHSGGGGAGGYSGPGGNGGYGGVGNVFYVPTAGTGGGGGGGYLGLDDKNSNTGNPPVLPGGGGGVGLFGEGTSGTAAGSGDSQPNGATGGGGGSGGAKGNDGGFGAHQVGVPDTKSKGGLYGGGGGGGGDTIHAGGGSGAVAIFWEQPVRLFAPNTQYLIGVNTTEVPLSTSVDTEYLIGNNTAEPAVSMSVDTEYLIGNNTAEPTVSMSVDTEYLIGNTTAEIPLTMAPGRYAREFTTPGTYSWTAPAGVTSVSAVAVGGGGSGNISGGGGGGGLGWKNNIPVVPGQTYTVQVGSAGTTGYDIDGVAGGESYFINTSTVAGFGGLGRRGLYYEDPLGQGGGYVGDGGGNGGRSRGGPTFNNYYYYGGGGAGGYSGDGGAGGEYRGQGDTVAAVGQPGQGGGGAGGHGVRYADPGPDPNGDGGGVGIYGIGASGSTNGDPGSGGVGKLYGGGAQGASESVSLNTGRSGGGGAVRIIWGSEASFPNNAG
jgi:hypothetical protein